MLTVSKPTSTGSLPPCCQWDKTVIWPHVRWRGTPTGRTSADPSFSAGWVTRNVPVLLLKIGH
jgi:hypothetical protein